MNLQLAMILLTIVIFVIILGLLVFVHELGHFIVAKRAGMKVEEFGFGFPPRMFGLKRGETIYSINWIPLGGFVKILGENGDSEDPRSFASKSAGKRFWVLIAGVSMNFVLAAVLMSIGAGIGLPTVVVEGEQLPKNAQIRDVSVAIISVAPASPAQEAGVKVGDRILAVNGLTIDSVEQMQEATQVSAGKATEYLFKRGKDEIRATITPRLDPPPDEGRLGVALASVGYVRYPWYQVIPQGIVAAFRLLVATISAFWFVISHWISGQGVNVGLAGPVGIAVLTRDVAQLGFVYLMQFTAVLSVNLAVINAIPFPALDGGRVLFLAIEKIRGKKLPQQAEAIANTVGFALLILLMLFVTVKDVSKFNILDRIKNIL
ncbi:MAG: site-2 protease family protein [Candidatus Doudnabacteria bacterium]|nr:site-2 protease family protein [Candidatus Doudnabacteria bacterium]